ncbi:MAG TPA: transcription termination/antitermination NusG family protein [Tepidisphaeraceae bacterium]|nr:transcription termination/antitermination NusG family protein [Tepidisphaeraceae bacterium]
MLKLDENPPLRSSSEPLEAAQGQWWVAHTKSRCEKSLAWSLFGKNIPYFFPMVMRTAVWGGRKRKVLKPLFPSYLFFCGSEEERQAAFLTGHLFMTIAVRQRQQFIRELCAIETAMASNVDLELENLIIPGRRCRVSRGALKGIEGTIIQRHGRTRLLLEVSIVGRGTSLEIDGDLLESID